MRAPEFHARRVVYILTPRVQWRRCQLSEGKGASHSVQDGVRDPLQVHHMSRSPACSRIGNGLAQLRISGTVAATPTANSSQIRQDRVLAWAHGAKPPVISNQLYRELQGRSVTFRLAADLLVLSPLPCACQNWHPTSRWASNRFACVHRLILDSPRDRLSHQSAFKAGCDAMSARTSRETRCG